MTSAPTYGTTSVANDAAVYFYPYSTETTTGLPINQITTAKQIRASKEVFGIETSKSKRTAGTFSITLSPSTPWIDEIHPGTWCFIYIKSQPLTGTETSELDSGLKMVGIVRSVRQTEAYSPDGRRHVRYLVSGEDFHSFLNFPIYLFTLASQVGSPIANNAINFGVNFLGVKPDALVPAIFRNLIGGRSAKALGDGGVFKVQGLTDTQSTNRPIVIPQEVHQRIWGPDLANPQNSYLGMILQMLQTNLAGKLYLTQQIGGQISPWSFLQTYINPVLNELYTEMLPVNAGGPNRLVPCMVLRSIPFSTSTGKPHQSCIGFTSADDLSIVQVRKTRTTASGIRIAPDTGSHFFISTNIDEKDIYDLHLGRSDMERFNMFAVPAELEIGPNLNLGTIEISNALRSASTRSQLVDDISIARYGSRPYITQTNYQIDTGVPSTLLFSKIARDMWINAYLFQSGVIRMRGSDAYIPVGTNAAFVSRPILAHIERVEHRYTVSADGKSKHFDTSLFLTRVQQPNGRPLTVNQNNPDGSASASMVGSAVSTNFKPGT